MNTLHDFQPMTRAKLARLSLPDIRAYAKAYKVPVNVIEQGTIDELLDSIFRLRPRHPDNYPMNTPHLFTHEAARMDRDGELSNQKPYTGFARRQDPASFRGAKSWLGHPVPPEQVSRANRAAPERFRLGRAGGDSHGNLPAQPEDQPVASSSVLPTIRQRSALAGGLQETLAPAPTSSHRTLSQAPSRGNPSPSRNTIPSEDALVLSQTEMGTLGGTSERTQEERVEHPRRKSKGKRLPPVPPPLGFEVADDLSNLKSALEEYEETVASQPNPSRIIVDDELFGLEFTPDMSQAGKEAVIRERYAIAASNHKMIEQMLAEAEAEAKQALWQLTALQPELIATYKNIEGFLDGFWASTNSRGKNLMIESIYDAASLAKRAWENEWNEEWVYTEDDQMEAERLMEIAQARAASSQVPPSPSAPMPHSMSGPSRKRGRDEDEGEPEYLNEDRPRVGTPEPGSKRPRIDIRKTSLVPSSPYPKRKGKGRAHSVEDTTLPLPTRPFHVPPSPTPRFGPQDRCNICPLYRPAVPGYELQKPRAEDWKLLKVQVDESLPPSDVGDGSSGSSELGCG